MKRARELGVEGSRASGSSQIRGVCLSWCRDVPRLCCPVATSLEWLFKLSFKSMKMKHSDSWPHLPYFKLSVATWGPRPLHWIPQTYSISIMGGVGPGPCVQTAPA